MRVLITGASGLLGLNLGLAALRSETVIGLDRGRLVSPPFDLIQANLLEEEAIESALRQSQAEVVIHCAAIADVDLCERDPSMAWRVNADLAGRVATVCSKGGVNLVHISTDAVFDGAGSRPYTEADETNPIGVYAETKRAAEMAVLSAHPHAIVARVNFYGWSVSGARSLAEFFVNNLSSGVPVRGFTDVTFCPMLVDHLAGILLRMIKAGLHGLYHAVGAEAMTKYEFGLRLARRFGFDGSMISKYSVDEAGLSARRSHNLDLSVDKLSTALGGVFPDFSTGLNEFYTQYSQGYPQQIRSYQQVAPGRKRAPLKSVRP